MTGRANADEGQRTARAASRSLRAVLSAILAALVVTSAVLASRSTPPASTGTLPAANSSTTSTTSTTTPPSTTPGGSGTTTPTTTTTTVPGASTGPVGRSTVGHGCGLALGQVAGSRPVGHCAVLEIGDSLGADLGWGLARHLSPSAGLDVVQLDKSSTGLANSWYYNWPVELTSYLARYHPQLLIVCLGGNDEQAMNVDGSSEPFGSAAWKRAYLGYVRQIVDEATASGAYVLWVGMPVMQPTSYNQGMVVLNSLFEQGVTSERDATFVPTSALFADPDGRFQSEAFVDGVETSLRAPDGIHFSFAGEDVLATYVIREMALVYHVSLAPTSPVVITGWR